MLAMMLQSYQLQISLVRDQYLLSLQRYGDNYKTCLQTCACDPYNLHGDQAY